MSKIAKTPLLEDRLLPFMLNNAPVRGRLVRLGYSVQDIVTAHDYPPCLAKILGESLLIVAMLSAQLKDDGLFGIQIKGDSAVPMLVADATFDGDLRAYAQMEEALSPDFWKQDALDLVQLFGENAHLSITLEQGAGSAAQRYQGVVALEGRSLADAVAQYFTQSQQVSVAFSLAFRAEAGKNKWHAAGMMIEQMPDIALASGGDDAARQEAWSYANAMLQTLQEDELLDAHITQEVLLDRLYHEQGVLVFAPKKYQAKCRCSRERIQRLLLSMSEADRVEMIVDGAANVHCQFCNQVEKFTMNDLNLGKH
jgi:molecular chaperone Hsp33